MAELAKLDDLLARLDWELDDSERRIAASALEDLSDDARRYGSTGWVSEAAAPRGVRTLILRAAVRYMRNPDGYIQSRAGDEIVGWAPRKEAVGAAEFTSAEKDEIKDMARRNSTLQTVGTYAYMAPGASQRHCGHVPVHYHGKDFRFFP